MHSSFEIILCSQIATLSKTDVPANKLTNHMTVSVICPQIIRNSAFLVVTLCAFKYFISRAPLYVESNGFEASQYVSHRR